MAEGIYSGPGDLSSRDGYSTFHRLPAFPEQTNPSLTSRLAPRWAGLLLKPRASNYEVSLTGRVPLRKSTRFDPHQPRPDHYDAASRLRLPEEYRVWVESEQNTLGDLYRRQADWINTFESWNPLRVVFIISIGICQLRIRDLCSGWIGLDR